MTTTSWDAHVVVSLRPYRRTPQIEVIRANVIGTLTLADVTNTMGIHLTTYATGCIFHYDDGEFKEGNGVGFKESDTPNFLGSYYSKTKVRRAAARRV